MINTMIKFSEAFVMLVIMIVMLFKIAKRLTRKKSKVYQVLLK